MPSLKEKVPRPLKAPATAPADPLRKLNFGTILRKQENPKASVPVLPDPNGQLAVVASRIIERNAKLEALGGALELDKAELKTLATPFYFSQASGKVEPAGSLNVLCPEGEVLICFPNRYGRLESEEPLLPVLGERAGQFFRQAFTLEIDGDKLPADTAQQLIDQLQQLFSRYQAAEALKVRESVKPLPDFHTVRHTALSPEQNLALNQICPIIAMVKPKARVKEGA